MFSLRVYSFWVLTHILLAAAAVRWGPPQYVPTVLVFLVLSALLLGTLYLARYAGAPFEVDSCMPEPPNEAVDPWAIQRTLMEASDQFIPERPAITNTSVLYAALIMEESGETFESVALALGTMEAHANKSEDRQLAWRLRGRLLSLAALLEAESKELRRELKGREFYLELTEAEALPLFDGTTDLTVVNCGFALASGLPGADGYLEVGVSNLSKRNPDTLVIDKTKDGKWVKGINYQEPDLAKVLRSTAAPRARLRIAPPKTDERFPFPG